jgi:hypothetical protein
MTKFHGLVAALGVFVATTAMSTPIAGTSLQTTITGMGGLVDVQNDQYNHDELWLVGATGMAAARIQFEFGGFAALNSFGIYDLYNPTSRLTIFSGADSSGALSVVLNLSNGSFCSWAFGGGSTCTSFYSNQFGFFLDTPTGDTFYSQKSLNGDGLDHMVAFEGGPASGNLGGNPWLASEFMLAWEDLYGGGDKDYDDFVVLVESIVGVPEPTGIAVFGIGLMAFGMFAMRRRLLGSRIGRR